MTLTALSLPVGTAPAAWLAAMLCIAAPLSQAAEYPALLDWSGRVTLTLPVSGVLESVAARAGQSIRKGELLASLNPALFKAGVAEARADMDRLSEEQADAMRDLERVRELYARTVASTTELDAAKLRHARASSGLAAAQARVERARQLLADAELRAPFDALILQRHAEPGLVITSQCQPAAVLTVARADQLIARARLDAAQAQSVKPGDAVEVVLAASSLPSQVSAISASPDQHYEIEVAIPRLSGLLPGASVRLRLP